MKEMRTWHVMADFGYELGAAGVAVNLALHEEAGVAVHGPEKGQEGKGRGQEDDSLERLCHCSCLMRFCWLDFSGLLDGRLCMERRAGLRKN